MAAVLALECALGIATFQAQVQWYTALSPGIVSGFQQLNRIAPRDAALAISPAAAVQDGWPLGWWAEGLLDRPTYYASDPTWLNFPIEQRNAAIANRMFDPTVGLSGAIELARANHINYIVVATGWQGYRAWASKGGGLEGATVVIDTDSLLVVSVGG
jgi:hypothetical protein